MGSSAWMFAFIWCLFARGNDVTGISENGKCWFSNFAARLREVSQSSLPLTQIWNATKTPYWASATLAAMHNDDNRQPRNEPRVGEAFPSGNQGQ